METLNKIKKESEKIYKQIKENENRIEELCFSKEIATARETKQFDKIVELHQKANENDNEVIKLSQENYKLHIKAQVLRNNKKAALFNECYPIILKAFEKYNGKPYGEQTRKKIYEEVKSHGYGFYISLNTNYQMTIYELEEDGYKYPSCVECEVFAMDENDHTAEFITGENKINIANVKAKPRNRYRENPSRETTAIIKAIENHQKAVEKARETADTLRQILPEGITKPEYVNSYKVWF